MVIAYKSADSLQTCVSMQTIDNTGCDTLSLADDLVSSTNKGYRLNCDVFGYDY